MIKNKKTKENIYKQFINACLRKTYSSEIKLYKHRIIPGHEGGTYTRSNILWCSYKDHCLAHYYRWLNYKKKEDLLAWKLMTSQTENTSILAGQIGGKAVQKLQRQNQTHFYDPSAKIQKLGNFKRWGLVIGNERIAYAQLKPSFIEFYKTYLLDRKNKKFTTNQYKQICSLTLPIDINKAQKICKNLFLEDKKNNQLKSQKGYVARLGAFHRNGIKINNKQIPFKNLHPSFIEYHDTYHIMNKTKKSYTKEEYEKICSLTLDQIHEPEGEKLYKLICINNTII